MYTSLAGRSGVILLLLFPPEQEDNNDPAPKVPDAPMMAAFDKNVRLLTVDCFLVMIKIFIGYIFYK